jgi:hypothetical protein
VSTGDREDTVVEIDPRPRMSLEDYEVGIFSALGTFAAYLLTDDERNALIGADAEGADTPLPQRILKLLPDSSTEQAVSIAHESEGAFAESFWATIDIIDREAQSKRIVEKFAESKGEGNG